MFSNLYIYSLQEKSDSVDVDNVDVFNIECVTTKM